jgi:hypothetical protein
LKNVESNFQLEKKKTSQRPKSVEKPKKRCPKGTVRDKETGECVEKKKKQLEPKKPPKKKTLYEKAKDEKKKKEKTKYEKLKKILNKKKK